MDERNNSRHKKSRSRKGAWIEMSIIGGALSNSAGRSRKGAWIEIDISRKPTKAQNSRSRKGAWIEILPAIYRLSYSIVAPVRERGLK